MTIPQFFSNLTLIFTLMGLAAVVEIAVPMVSRPAGGARFRANLGMTVVALVSNAVLISATAFLAAGDKGAGLFARAGIPPAAQLVLGIVVLDFGFGYLAHRLMHVFPVL